MPLANEESRLKTATEWLRQSPFHWRCLQVADQVLTGDWAISAGFLRNLIWDHLHDQPASKPQDIDVLVMEGDNQTLQSALKANFPANWSVKNQHKMHSKRGLPPCTGFNQAMTFWLEKESAVAVRLSDGDPVYYLPYSLSPPFDLTVSATDYGRQNPEACRTRFAKKAWTTRWHKLRPDPVFTKS